MTTEELRALAPHQSAFDLNEPKRVSKNLSIPKPVVATIANFVHSYHPEEYDPIKQQNMDAIPDFDSWVPPVVPMEYLTRTEQPIRLKDIIKPIERSSGRRQGERRKAEESISTASPTDVIGLSGNWQ